MNKQKTVQARISDAMDKWLIRKAKLDSESRGYVIRELIRKAMKGDD